MKYIYLALNWFFGFTFLVLGLFGMTDSLWAGLCLILMASLLLPPVRRFCFAKFKFELSGKLRASTLFVLFIAFGIFAGQEQRQEEAAAAALQAQQEAELIARVRQENIDYFNANRGQIISSVKLALAENEYQSVIAQSGKYLVSGDSELAQLNSEATSKLEEIEAAERAAREQAEAAARAIREREENEAKTRELLTALESIPESQYQSNLNHYRQLVALNPDNARYIEQMEFYARKLQEQMDAEKAERDKVEAERQLRIAMFGTAPVQSAWDGSYRAVDRYLEMVANDPDSIKMDGCTKVYQTDDGWLVGCDYRGSNAFGGIIRQSNWFTIAHDQVVQMHDASAYKP